MEHILKIQKKYFDSVLSGTKSFEIRKTDRLYSVGDKLVLFEIDEQKRETGRNLVVKVTYVLFGPIYGLEDGYCILAVKRSGRQNRNCSGNHPTTEFEVIEYAKALQRSKDSAEKFFNYYSMTGWKMKNGLPVADWKAAFRNWKDYQSKQLALEPGENVDQIALILPILLKKIGELSIRRSEAIFRDPHVGTVVQFYGFDRLEKPFSSYDVKDIVNHYLTSKRLALELRTCQSKMLTEGGH